MGFATRILCAPLADDTAGGTAPPAPETPPIPGAAEGEDDGPLLVREEADPATPPATPPAPPAAAVPVTPAETPDPALAAPAPKGPGTEAAVQKLQQDVGVVMRRLEEIAQRLATPAPVTPATPAAPAAPAVPATEDELQKMLSETYEVDVEQTPRQLAREVLNLRKQLQEQLAAVKQQAEQTQAETRAERSAREQAEAAAALAQLRAEYAGTDLNAVWRECHQAAVAAGWDTLGPQALQRRAEEIWAEKLTALAAARAPAPSTNNPPAPASPAPASPAPAPVRGAPVPSVSPGGAAVKASTSGGNPQRPAAAALVDYDEIDARHTLAG